MKMLKQKKGVIDQLFPIVTSLVVIAIALAIGFLIMSEVKSNSKIAADVNATASITETQKAMDDIPGWIPIIIITIIGALIISLVGLFRGGRR